MNDKHIRIAKGESRIWTCTVTTDGVPLSLNGCSISFTVKSKLTHTDGQAIFKLFLGSGIAISDTTGGIYTLSVSTLSTSGIASTGNNWIGYYDHRIKTSAGEVKQLEMGEFIVTPGVTDTVV